ncbi:prepilin-type N-terminal cleavage/methylation domain-containing protein [bacterium]|nr:prepilin-type N-terminal cleavage/methylation domain-containing protein [bacterium]
MNKTRNAHTLIEVLVAVAVFSIITTLLALIFVEGLSVLRRTSGRDSAAREMRRARTVIVRDLATTRPSLLTLQDMPDNLGGGGKDGQAFWFLSPVDPTTGQIARTADGLPLWQVNILYYLVVPQNHDVTFGIHCNGAIGPGSYDDCCAHKVLIRKVIRTSATPPEALLTSVAPYLTRPDGLQVDNMAAEPNLLEVKLAATSLLYLRAQLAPNSIPNLVDADLRAVDIQTARKKSSLGAISLYQAAPTLTLPFSVLLKN